MITPAVGAELLLYVEQRFKLRINDQLVTLTPVGAEIDGDYLYVYQELVMRNPPMTLAVENRLLHDFFPDQLNLVNWVIGDEVRTLPLSVARPAATLRLGG